MAAGSHVCAILDDDTVRCWGGNQRGQLGNPQVTNLPDGGYAFDDRTVTRPQIASVGKVTQISTGGMSTCALLPDAQVHCWGDDLGGELGRGDAGAQDRQRPHPEHGPVTALGAAEQVALKGGLVAAIRGGHLYAWGPNEYYYDFRGTNPNPWLRSPVEIPIPTGRSAKQLALGSDHGCVVLDDATLACWGTNSEGQLGTPLVPVPERKWWKSSKATTVPSLSGVAEVAAGDGTTCVRMVSGQVQCFGGNRYGLRGRGMAPDASAPDPETDRIPAPIVGLPIGVEVAQVAMGWQHACVLLADGTVWCWGNSSYGELGKPGTRGSDKPVKVEGLPKPATYVITGDRVTCALLSDRSVMCWGDNRSGALGQGTTDEERHDQPVQVHFP
ncbi:RCC1 domain-containing protein [Pendulispora albinea]|uniref:RCC1-like domain-containing protein n=1 Tax=Pendulispora albinea TaxID=2741071 RepID=A0ABZ2LKH4_9BACT